MEPPGHLPTPSCNPVGMPLLIHAQPDNSVCVHYKVKCVKRLAITQLLLGILSVIFQIGAFINQSFTYVVGTGLWTGVLFIIAGALGIHSSKNKEKCWITSFLVLSILAAAAFAVALLITSIMDIIFGYGFQYGPDDHDHDTWVTASVSIASILLIISVVEVVIAVISSAFACHALCTNNSQPGAVVMQGQVQYMTGANGQTQVTIVPIGQASGGQQIVPNGAVYQPGQLQNNAKPSFQPPGYEDNAAPPPEYYPEKK